MKIGDNVNKDILTLATKTQESLDEFGELLACTVTFNFKKDKELLEVLKHVIDLGRLILSREEVLVLPMGLVNTELESLIGHLTLVVQGESTKGRAQNG